MAEALDAQRSKLVRLESVLGCLHVALLHAGERGPRVDPDFASTADMALSLVRDAIDRLDTDFPNPIRRAIGKGAGTSRGHGRGNRRA